MDSVKRMCRKHREEIKELANGLAATLSHPEMTKGDQITVPFAVPANRNANVAANITLAYRHLEDARMRLGKAVQAIDGGVSIIDKLEQEERGREKDPAPVTLVGGEIKAEGLPAVEFGEDSPPTQPGIDPMSNTGELGAPLAERKKLRRRK